MKKAFRFSAPLFLAVALMQVSAGYADTIKCSGDDPNYPGAMASVVSHDSVKGCPTAISIDFGSMTFVYNLAVVSGNCNYLAVNAAVTNSYSGRSWSYVQCNIPSTQGNK